ncbi:MAG: hypothetical protein K2Z81_14100, partial [Cyanobacteria bacterium]|nr:hypothetical protein [Cyanobacteriota bacterium]
MKSIDNRVKTADNDKARHVWRLEQGAATKLLVFLMTVLVCLPFHSEQAQAQNFQQRTDYKMDENDTRDERRNNVGVDGQNSEDMPVGRITGTAPLVGGVQRLDALLDKNGLDGGVN